MPDVRKSFTLYTFEITPHVPSYPADLAARVGSYFVRATGDRTLEEVTEAANAFTLWDPCETPFFRQKHYSLTEQQQPIDALRLEIGEEIWLWGSAAFTATVRAVEPGVVARSVPAEFDPGNFDVEMMEELDAEEASFHEGPPHDPTPREVYRITYLGYVTEEHTGRVFPIHFGRRRDREVTLDHFPFWVSVATDGVVPVEVGRIGLNVKNGPREFDCSNLAEIIDVRLNDIHPVTSGGPDGPEHIRVTYRLTPGDLPGYSGAVVFLVMSNGEFWKHRDRIHSLAISGPNFEWQE
jgi:hypothetical protein